MDCSGQGTMALEFLEQVPQLDAIIVPISGEGGRVIMLRVLFKSLYQHVTTMLFYVIQIAIKSDLLLFSMHSKLMMTYIGCQRLAAFRMVYDIYFTLDISSLVCVLKFSIVNNFLQKTHPSNFSDIHNAIFFFSIFIPTLLMSLLQEVV